MNAQSVFKMLEDDGEILWQLYNGIDEDDAEAAEEFSDYLHLVEDGQLDMIGWINDQCLEATPRDLLLATGGPAYGISLVHGSPVAWFQDWFEGKELCHIKGDAGQFYAAVFEELEELS